MMVSHQVEGLQRMRVILEGVHPMLAPCIEHCAVGCYMTLMALIKKFWSHDRQAAASLALDALV